MSTGVPFVSVREPKLRLTVRAHLVALLILLGAGLIMVVAAGVSLALAVNRGTAVAPLPLLRSVTAQAGPRFLFSLHGPVQPLGVALSSAGDRIYVTESAGERETRVYDRDGRQVGALNPPGSTPANRVPVYVATAPDGRVFVSDRVARTVYTYAPDGAYLGRFEPHGLPHWQPLALAFDSQDDLLVTDVTPGQHSVLVLTLDGAIVHRFGQEGTGDGQFSYPNGVAVDGAGRIFVSDSNNGRIVVMAQDGSPLGTLGRGVGGAPLQLPRGLVVDDLGRLYVADTSNHVVDVFEVREQGPRLLFKLGSEGIQDGQFNYPNGLALDAGGRLYVTDRENNRVQVWTY